MLEPTPVLAVCEHGINASDVCAAQSSRSCRHSKQHATFDGVAAQLQQVRDAVEQVAGSSGDVVLPALQRQLQALLVQELSFVS